MVDFVASPARLWLLVLLSIANPLASSSARAAQYAIDGFTLGQPVVSGNPNYRSYICKPNQQYAEAVDCERTQQRKIGRDTVAVVTTLVHTQDGAVIYVMMDVAPAAMSSAAVQGEIDELSRAIGAKPESVDRQERDGDVTAIVTAQWGGIKLEDVQGSDLDTLTAGGSLRLGLALDPLGNTKLSAEQYLPISRITGGAGYIYSASFDKGGRVHRRYIAIDPKQIAIRQFRLSLQNILQQDNALPSSDYHLWPDIAWIARNLARDTSIKTVTDLLDTGFEKNHSTKLRSHIWPLLPLGAIGRLAAGQYSRMDIYGAATRHAEVRRDIKNFLAEHPADPFVDFAYYLLGDYEKALKANSNSPIADVLHYGTGYKLLESLMQDTLLALKKRITPDTPSEIRETVDQLVDESPDTDYHVNSVLQVANASWKLSDREPLASVLPSFAGRAAAAQLQFAAVLPHTTSPIADDAAYMIGWLNLQLGKTDAALANFSQALVIGNGDYKPAATWETLRIMERLSSSRQLAMVRADRAFSQQPPLWYEAARTAYRNFEYALAIEAGKQALQAFNIPFDDLPVTTDPDRITAAIEKVNRELSIDGNVNELPYLIEASKEMLDYEAYLKNAGKEPPAVFTDNARKIILKYSMLVNPPEPVPGRPKPPPVHRDLRQALHLIDLTLEVAPKDAPHARLREWLRFRTVRAMVFYAPERVPQAIAALAAEFPASKLLDDALAEQIFAEGILMKDPDAAQKTFSELLSKYPDGNAIDNAYSWMAIIMRCANRLEEEKKLNAEIIRRFPLTRHAKYARERMAQPDACGL
jgi:tetratricopeptide (TPR) repeat protein